jgi:hypothetical protein
MTQPPWQPQYGQQQPYYYPPPVKQGNGFAVAGIILAIFAPLLGLIFSIIGLAKSGARAGAGRALSIVGIVLSVVVGTGGTIAVLTLVHHVANSTAADPGCISAEADAIHMGKTITADGAAINRDASNPSAVQTDLQKFVTDMHSLQGSLSSAQAEATHQSVKTQIAALTSDINTLNTSLQAIARGDTSQANAMIAAANKLQSDGNTLDSTCSTL